MFDNDIQIFGKHSSYLKKYSKDKNSRNMQVFKVHDFKQEQKDVYLFDTMMQGYLVGAMIGMIEGRESKPDHSIDGDAKIFAEKVNKTKSDLKRILTFMILSNEDYGSVDERIKKAFTVEHEDQKELENRITRFACGGLEIINDQFEGCKTEEDVLFAIQRLNNKYNLNC